MGEIGEHDPETGWGDRVRFAGGPGGFAYRPGEVVVAGDNALETARRMYVGLRDVEPTLVFGDVDDPRVPRFFVLRGDVDPVEASEALRDDGWRGQPNHIVFAHGTCCCGPHPAQLWSGCLSGAPVYASPVYASPVYASPLQATGRRRSSAVPATAPSLPSVTTTTPARPVRVAVLDTGMAGDGDRPAALDHLAPAAEHWERPDGDGDNELDPAAGHGTFIAGLVELLAPGCAVQVEKVLSSYGEGDEVAVAQRVASLAGTVDIVNLSFGGYALERMDVLAAAVRWATSAGTVVVASAGNDGVCRPTFPAALRDVVSVGAVGPSGPAPFSNYGPWVRACAPGVDIVSWFFAYFDGPATASAGSVDPDRFVEWAKWSGTSFAAPTVSAALAREMLTYGVDARTAVARVVDAPGLLRIPGLGTVVNVV